MFNKVKIFFRKALARDTQDIVNQLDALSSRLTEVEKMAMRVERKVYRESEKAPMIPQAKQQPSGIFVPGIGWYSEQETKEVPQNGDFELAGSPSIGDES